MGNALPIVLWSGFLAGSVHVVTGIDHMAALLPLSVGRRFRAFGLGARWGVGHSAGVLLMGLLAVALKQRLDLVAAGALGERLVGVMLIAIGLLGLRSALRIEIHSHPHPHDGDGHAHLHVHAPRPPEQAGPHAVDRDLHRHSHAAFAAGTIHGVAGTAHILGVLPALALPGWVASAGYLLAFAAGTILSMGAFSAAVGEGSARAGSRAPALLKGLMYGASWITIVVGMAWLTLPALERLVPRLA